MKVFLKKWEKRREFFEQNQTDKIKKAEAIIKFGSKLLNFIEQIEGTNEKISSRR